MKMYRGVTVYGTRDRQVWSEEPLIIPTPSGERVVERVTPLAPADGANGQPWDWGRISVGAWHLALALLIDGIGDEARVRGWAPLFVEEFVCRWGDRWMVSSDNLLVWLEHVERQAAVDIAVAQLFLRSGVGTQGEEEHGEKAGGADVESGEGSA